MQLLIKNVASFNSNFHSNYFTLVTFSIVTDYVNTLSRFLKHSSNCQSNIQLNNEHVIILLLYRDHNSNLSKQFYTSSIVDAFDV